MIPDNWNGCNNCRHLEVRDRRFVCAAFPDGIPMGFASGDVPHVMVIDGQTGETVWELRAPQQPQEEEA